MSFWSDSVSESVATDAADPLLTPQLSPVTASLRSYRAVSTHIPSDSPLVSSKSTTMPGFADSFWSSDYAGGLGVLFQKLQQGVTENQQILTIATMRADAEELYSGRLGDIAPTVDRMTGGFTRDDGASLRKVIKTAIWLSLLADHETGL
jgi:hypothetical protein